MKLSATGQPAWGISWYVNGIIIPELHLERGVTYTFRVGGGTDPMKGSMYHPLYFTDSLIGGFEQVCTPTNCLMSAPQSPVYHVI